MTMKDTLYAIYAIAYIMALSGLILFTGSRLNKYVSGTILIVGTITAFVTAYLYTY